ncbi:hypothetical protein OH77DRAFT_1518061 [Trametes cingulata]|nr:hypothetical protein OH77DRAFT_1518061 [Trametes cingulata]
MSSIDVLPTELILRVLSYLPLQSLRNVRLLARRWNDFVVANQSTIYHHAALLHNFIDSLDTLLPQAKEARCLKFLEDVPDWYQYCQKYFQLQKNWTGAGVGGTPKFYGGHPYDIHRIKVDEKHGLVITTHEFGGLTVFDMDTSEVLWRLSTGYVRRYAHCEYENGFLIFDRIGISKEVWRLETLYDAAEEPTRWRPDQDQLNAWQTASLQYSASAPRGHFRPWALIETPEFGRAYRFVYPGLLVSGLRKAYVWDVRTGELILELENVQGDTPVGDINYVELSAKHVFVCSSSALRVFSRENRSLILEIPSYQLVYSDVRLAVKLDRAVARHGIASPGEIVYLPGEPTQTTALYTASYAEFSSVHVSRDGRDIVAQLSDSRQIVICDFMRVVRGEVPLEKAVLEIGKTLPQRQSMDEHFSIYLALEHGRAGIATTSGVYVLTLDPTHHGVLDPDRAARENPNRIPRAAIEAGLSAPYIRIAALPYYADRRQLAKVSCVQMTETKLFFVWDAMYKPDSIDFFRQLGMVASGSGGPGTAAGAGAGAGQVQGLTVEAGVQAGAEAEGEMDIPVAVPAAALPGGSWHTVGEGSEAQWEVEAGAPAGQTGDAVWDAPGIEETALVSAGQPEAGPSNGPGTAMNANADANVETYDVDFVELNDDDEDEWEDAEDDDADSFDEQDFVQDPVAADIPLLPGALPEHNFVSTGPIVFCVDFSPA